MKPCRNEYKAENVNNRISLTDTVYQSRRAVSLTHLFSTSLCSILFSLHVHSLVVSFSTLYPFSIPPLCPPLLLDPL